MTQETRPSAGTPSMSCHWLTAERASFDVVSQWVEGFWYSPGEQGPISPEEMFRRGWRYRAPAIDLTRGYRIVIQPILEGDDS